MLRIKEKQQQKPWITNAIRKSILIKNKYYKKFIKSNNHIFNDKYRQYRNKITHLIWQSKANHFKACFMKFKNNSKKVWIGINKILNKNVSKSQNIVLNYKGKIISNQKTVADEFNNFFH